MGEGVFVSLLYGESDAFSCRILYDSDWNLQHAYFSLDFFKDGSRGGVRYDADLIYNASFEPSQDPSNLSYFAVDRDNRDSFHLDSTSGHQRFPVGVTSALSYGLPRVQGCRLRLHCLECLL